MNDDRPYCFIVREGRDASVLCNKCAAVYVGAGDLQPLEQDDVGNVLVCGSCGADLANPDAMEDYH